MDWLWVTLVVGGLVGMAWLAARIEPHWVSKDGERFICNGQRLSAQFIPEGRWREVRAAVMQDGAVLIGRRRRLTARARGSRSATTAAPVASGGEFWTVTGRAPTSPRKSLVAFVLRRRDDTGAWSHLVVRVPGKSRAVATLDRISADRRPPASTGRGTS
jgi:hypothetical protein